MKKIYLTLIIATLLIGVITAGTIILNKEIVIDLDIFGKGEKNENLLYNYTYSERLLDNGKTQVCVYKDKMSIAPCRFVDDSKLINAIEQEMIFNYISLKLQEQPTNPIEISKTKGSINLIPKG